MQAIGGAELYVVERSLRGRVDGGEEWGGGVRGVWEVYVRSGLVGFGVCVGCRQSYTGSTLSESTIQRMPIHPSIHPSSTPTACHTSQAAQTSRRERRTSSTRQRRACSDL